MNNSELAQLRTTLADNRTKWAELRTTMAEERTILAWQRTGISFMGFSILWTKNLEGKDGREETMTLVLISLAMVMCAFCFCTALMTSFVARQDIGEDSAEKRTNAAMHLRNKIFSSLGIVISAVGIAYVLLWAIRNKNTSPHRDLSVSEMSHDTIALF